MTSRVLSGLVFGGLVASVALLVAAEAPDDAIRKDRTLLVGTWRIVALEVNGNPASTEDARKLTVVNLDDTWSLRSEGKEVSRGINVIDPSKSPKSIDLIVIEDGKKGDAHPGIYEISQNSRKLCFAPPGMSRPTEFKSPPESQRILVTFEREPPK